MAPLGLPRRIRDWLILLVLTAVPFALARSEWVSAAIGGRAGAQVVFRASTVLFAVAVVIVVGWWVRRLVVRDLARAEASGAPREITALTFAALYFALLTPFLALLAVNWAWEHWADGVRWLRRLLEG